MIQLPEEFDSIFRYIVVVSQRTEQLMAGARPRQESSHAKPTLQAKGDVDAGLVEWRVLTQEELDAQRQAMVEQFRAEMSADEAAAASPGVRDVLPTASEGEPARPVLAEDGDEDADRDDELLRLQRMLGIAGGASTDDDEAESDDDGDDDDDGDSDDDSAEAGAESLEELDLDDVDDDEDEED